MIKEFISHIHWIPVITMSLFSFILGALWHSKALFGKTWAEENKADTAKLRSKAGLIFGGTAVLHFLALAALGGAVSGKGATGGFWTGLLISLVWILPPMGGTYFFAGRSIKLLAIDAGMYIVLFSVSGFVLAVW